MFSTDLSFPPPGISIEEGHLMAADSADTYCQLLWRPGLDLIAHTIVNMYGHGNIDSPTCEVTDIGLCIFIMLGKGILRISSHKRILEVSKP